MVTLLTQLIPLSAPHDVLLGTTVVVRLCVPLAGLSDGGGNPLLLLPLGRPLVSNRAVDPWWVVLLVTILPTLWHRLVVLSRPQGPRSTPLLRLVKSPLSWLDSLLWI